MKKYLFFLIVLTSAAPCKSVDAHPIDKRMYSRKNIDESVSTIRYFDDNSVCNTINYYNTSQEKKEEGFFEFLNRVVIPVLVGLFAILGFFLSLFIYRQQDKNRASDLHAADISFWLKEVVFPTYLHPCIEKIRAQQSIFVKVAEGKYQADEIDSILEAWEYAGGEIRTLLSFGGNLPFFSEPFVNLQSRWTDIDDRFISTLYPNDLANFAPPNQTVDTIPILESKDKQLLVEFVSFIYTSISTVQNGKKPSNDKKR